MRNSDGSRYERQRNIPLGPGVGAEELRNHRQAPVKKWLAEHTTQIEVFYLSSYFPELNPDEQLNGDLKQAIETRVPCRTKDKLRNPATEHMTQIEKNPERIKNFFKDDLIQYAA